jgi:putative Mg2+ transporter-C (MgtC) family protein
MNALAATSLALDDDVVVRLIAATVFGGIIGFEREARDQEAGLRTHMAVALGAAMFGVVSTLGFLEFDQPRADSTVQVDVSRVASNVVVGIGFLGAGVIFRQGNTIKNLTTAASMWVVAAIGLACGVGDVTTGAVGTVVLLVTLFALRPIRRWIHRASASRPPVTVQVRLRRDADPAAAIAALHAREGPPDVTATDFAVRSEEGRLVLTTEATGDLTAVRTWISHLARAPGVEGAEEL